MKLVWPAAAGAVLLLQQHRQPLGKSQLNCWLLLRGPDRLLPLPRRAGRLQGQGQLLLCGGGRVEHGGSICGVCSSSGLVDA